LNKNKIMINLKFKLVLIVLYAFAGSLFAQDKFNYQPYVAGFEYIELVKGKDNVKLPLIIAFHYSAGTPTETIADYDSLKNPVRIILPKGNNTKRNGHSYFPTNYYEQESMARYTLAKITVDSIAKFVKAIEKKYKQKAIVSGISQGGDIAFLLAMYYPKLCKASFPFAAFIHQKFIEELKNKRVKKQVPIYLYQGESDKIIPVANTRKKVEEIGNSLKLKLYTYPNVEHEISVQMKMDYSKIIDEIIKQ
jgi:phospholipase/carboxylesterase